MGCFFARGGGDQLLIPPIEISISRLRRTKNRKCFLPFPLFLSLHWAIQEQGGKGKILVSFAQCILAEKKGSFFFAVFCVVAFLPPPSLSPPPISCNVSNCLKFSRFVRSTLQRREGKETASKREGKIRQKKKSKEYGSAFTTKTRQESKICESIKLKIQVQLAKEKLEKCF